MSLGLERWHLLSLDAPTVAVLWMGWMARQARASLPSTEFASMFIAVWLLYATDRLLDSRGFVDHATLEARHHYHRTHAARFHVAIVLLSLVLACLLTRMPEPELARFAVLGALLVGWFVVIHTGVRRLPKELGVGLFFAAAITIPAAVRSPAAGFPLMREAVLFGVLCWLNCVFIFAWEHMGEAPRLGHASTHLAAQQRVTLGVGLVAIAGLAGSWMVVAGALLLLAFNQSCCRFGRTTLRALADVALVLPVGLAGIWLHGLWLHGLWLHGLWLHGLWVQGLWVQGLWLH